MRLRLWGGLLCFRGELSSRHCRGRGGGWSILSLDVSRDNRMYVAYEWRERGREGRSDSI